MRENIKVQHLNCRGSTENGKKLETLSKKENLQVIRPKKTLQTDPILLKCPLSKRIKQNITISTNILMEFKNSKLNRRL